ncbi:MAG: sugar phosphate isomerase/epimerase family protein [Balneolaceae bacterium]|nr:sugar phosphate isomerase/epimerase family protein [Balneolaceae bacterium]
MTKVGFDLLAWSAVVSEDLLPTVERLKKIGYDGIEIFLGIEDKKVYRRFGEKVQDLGMELCCVMVLGPEENPIDASADVRQKGLDRIKWAIDRAHDMNAGLICGPMHSAFATFHDKAPDQDEYKRSAEVLRKAGEYAAQADILLTPEAINRFECYLCNTMEQLAGLVEQVDHPNVRAHFDTHHANIEEKTLAGALKTAAPVLGHVHISENDRGTPGSGHVPWDETFSTLSEIDYSGWLTIEAFTRYDPDFANSINVWREYNEPWDVAEEGYAFITKMSEKYGL